MFCPQEQNNDMELQATNLERVNTPNSETNVRWKSCCFYADRDAIVYFSQIFILFSFLSFCCLQLVRIPTCESQQLYSSLVTLVLGILCPNPRIKKR